MRAGDLGAMAAAIPDEVVDTFAIVAPDWDEAARRIRSRYEGLLDRVSLYGLQGMVDASDAGAIAAAFAAAGG